MSFVRTGPCGAVVAKLGPINPNRTGMTDTATELATGRALTQAIASGASAPSNTRTTCEAKHRGPTTGEHC